MFREREDANSKILLKPQKELGVSYVRKINTSIFTIFSESRNKIKPIYKESIMYIPRFDLRFSSALTLLC